MTIAGPTRVDAELFVREMHGGRNGAVLMAARPPEGGPSVECVVKLAAAMAKEHAAMLPLPYLCEWLAAAVGAALEMHVAAPYEVLVRKEYADAVADPRQRAIALASLGSAFGSEHVSAGTSQYTMELPDLALRSPAAELIAFDIFIHNPDRRRTNPNLFVSRAAVVAFDHGDAFSFLLPILSAPDPVTDPLEKCVEDHACRPWLHDRDFSLERFREALGGLTDEVLDEIAAATPAAWTTGPATGKLSYVIEILKKRRDAVEEWLPRVESWIRK